METRVDKKLSTSSESSDWDLTVYVLNFFVFLLSIFFTFVLLIGAVDFFKNVEKNRCEMTYMYEFPQYVKIPMPLEGDKQFSMYGLYAYAEGKQIDSVRHFKFTGIPVLFLPGNAGSYKQVRSFASVALRKWLDSRTPFHFDFFTIDFHEEMSGIYGYVLQRQSHYARRAVDKIMSFYEDFQHVILIGHSMGGLIAKSINAEEIKSHLIYTFATPHQRALLLTDPEFDLFYLYVERNWTNILEAEGKQVTLVSVAGGDRDWIIPNKFTKWKYNHIQTSAPSIPGVWASTDHLCIVWCKQLVLTTVRSLFDMVEYRSKGKYYAITGNVTRKEDVLDYHFLKRTSGTSYNNAHSIDSEFGKPPSVSWNEYLKHDYCQAPHDKITYVMFPLMVFRERINEPSEDISILITTTNTKSKNWIFGCAGQTIVNNVRICSQMVNLSNRTEFLPSVHRRTKIVHLDYNWVERSEFSHLVVKMESVKYPTCTNTEVYDRKKRTMDLGTKLQTRHGIFFNLTYPMTFDLSRAFAWKLTAELQQKQDNDSQCHNSIGIFRNGNFSTHGFLKNESLLIRFTDWSTPSANVLLYFGKGCDYTVRVKLAWIETAGQLFRTYWRFLPTHIASIFLMTLYFQKPKNWVSLHQILIAKAYYLTLFPGFVTAVMIAVLPTDFRTTTMMSPTEYTVFIPIVGYLVAYAIVLVLATGAYFVTLATGSVVHAFTMRFLSKKLGNVPDKVTDLALTITLEKFPISVAVLIISLAMTTCGTMGLAIGLFLYLIKIFKLYEDFLEDLIRGKVKDVSEAMSPINFHIHTSMLWFVITLYNLPSLIYWINNFTYAQVPQWDLSLYVCLMLTPALAILWQGFVPDFNHILWNMQRHMCYMMGLVMVLWASHRFYLVCFMIVLVLITMAMCQLISRFAEPEKPELGEEAVPTKQEEQREQPPSQNSTSDDSDSDAENSKDKSQSEGKSAGKQGLENNTEPSSESTDE